MLLDSNTPFRSMVDTVKGTADRQIFSDQAIYEMELERIFARAWNFMCHESQIKKPGDFFLSFIGEESVIATRDKKGELQVLLNSCRHRGNAVCRAEEGNARSFLCTYHGWTYGLDGSLIGVPGYKDFYHEQLDKSQWGLVKAKVASYKGFVFATMDHEAPPLEDFLGKVGRMGLDFLAARGPLRMVQGIQKNIIGCNWKLAVDNLFDWYHVAISHSSAMQNDFLSGIPLSANPDHDHRVMFGEYGHCIGGPRMTEETWDAHKADEAAGLFEGAAKPWSRLWRLDPKVADDLDIAVDSAGHPNIFPNLWIASTNQLCLRLPRGPSATELWWFTPVFEDEPEAVGAARVHWANHIFGAAGMLEQDDGENWDQSTRAMRGPVAQRHPLNFAMSLGQGEVKMAPSGVPYVDGRVSERAQLWTYRAWTDWMDAESWAALKANHSPVPQEGQMI